MFLSSCPRLGYCFFNWASRPRRGHLSSRDGGWGENSSWPDPLTHPDSLICPNLSTDGTLTPCLSPSTDSLIRLMVLAPCSFRQETATVPQTWNPFSSSTDYWCLLYRAVLFKSSPDTRKLVDLSFCCSVVRVFMYIGLYWIVLCILAYQTCD